MINMNEWMSEHAPIRGGGGRIVQIGHTRPHAPIERFPPWYKRGYKAGDATQRDPLGLTPEQRAAGPGLSDVLREMSIRFMDQIRENMAKWDALPAGTMIHGCSCGQPHSV